MSLKGSELAREAALLASMKDEWESQGKSEFEVRRFSADEYGFEVFLCRKITDLQKQAAAQVCAANKWKKQRDLALILCVIFFVIAMLFAFRPAAASKDAAPVEAQAEETVSFAEWTRRQKAEYIASSESDKYHRRSCEYVENILDENRVYYDTAADAERDGKTACSLCRPHGVTITQKSTGKTWTSGG